MTTPITPAVPALTVLSLGAGVQSTTLALLACEGVLPRPDAAIFADVGWEPRRVYEHLDRLAAVLDRAGIPLYRVSHGDLRKDTVETTNYVRIPAFVQGAGGRAAILRRQCTQRYKLDPIKRQIRLLLGAKRSRSGAVLSPPPGRVAEQWVGFSTDEIGRVNHRYGAPYLRTRYPLLDLGWSWQKCRSWLASRGWGNTPRSSCIGCPFHGNREWRDLRDNQPEEWADAVDFDRRIRERPVTGPHRVPFLHRSLRPLDEAPLDEPSHSTPRRPRGDPAEADIAETGDPDGCSPYGCRSGHPAHRPAPYAEGEAA